MLSNMAVITAAAMEASAFLLVIFLTASAL